jgi:hypothetical protein
MNFTKHTVLVVAATGLAVALSLSSPGWVAAGDDPAATCSNRTLRGSYGFAIDGQIFPPGSAPLTLRAVAMTEFDGEGGLAQVDHATLNGVPRWEGWRPAVGGYQINPDCTGTAEIIPSDGSPTLRLHLVVSDRGRQIRAIVNGNATGSLGVRVR